MLSLVEPRLYSYYHIVKNNRRGSTNIRKTYIDNIRWMTVSIAQSDSGYVAEMEIDRLEHFRENAMETRIMLVYTDDFADMKGTIQHDPDHAVFEVTESSSDLVQVGETWIFPEMQ